MKETPSTASDLLSEIQSLLELSGENPFRIRAFEKAAHQLAGRDDLLERAQKGTLQEIPGVGKGIAEILVEFLLQGRCSVLEELKKSISPALLELTQIPGLGPKKAKILIEELGIQSVGELEYACKENRLVRLKGFGEKAQKKILDAVILQASYEGYRKLSDVWGVAEELYRQLQKAFPGLRVSETGALRRKSEVLKSLDFMIALPSDGSPVENIQIKVDHYIKNFVKGLEMSCPIHLEWVESENFVFELARTTGSEAHWKALGDPDQSTFVGVSSEETLYSKLGLEWIPPEIRETGEEVVLAKSGGLKQLLPWEGLRGVFHNHTTRSDGSATLEEMVSRAEELGMEYIGISDHSQSAFYAQGLKENDLKEQYSEIQEVQARHPKIRVFWGIESDILVDGSLDYPQDLLEMFDFVVASIHSRFNMDRESMTERVLKAVRHPATRFLGHPTGRLLLGRRGFDIDLEAVIQEAARCSVAVELNANPNRLDLDWRWGPVMRKYQTLTSINPDAHDLAGLEDTRYGIAMARKALLPRQQVVNTQSAREVEKWLRRQ
jgi:DNA polymerase (family 10)